MRRRDFIMHLGGAAADESPGATTDLFPVMVIKD